MNVYNVDSCRMQAFWKVKGIKSDSLHYSNLYTANPVVLAWQTPYTCVCVCVRDIWRLLCPFVFIWCAYIALATYIHTNAMWARDPGLRASLCLAVWWATWVCMCMWWWGGNSKVRTLLTEHMALSRLRHMHVNESPHFLDVTSLSCREIGVVSKLVSGLTLVGHSAGLPWPYFMTVVACATHLAWQVRSQGYDACTYSSSFDLGMVVASIRI